MVNKILIILPTYNESGYIEKHLSELNNIRRTLSTDYEITFLNIDDSSPDGTAILAQKMQLADFEQILNSSKIGLGPAYLAGFSWGLVRDFDYFVEQNNHPFDSLIREQIDSISKLHNKIPVLTKSIYHKSKDDFDAFQMYKSICGRANGKTPMFTNPNLNHFCSNEFCWQSFLENATV